ncbi:hypothetical protein [Glaciecola sp. MF2-115]|uniref:hypothetical protein n=1 Tax=Glaciecola sp. MF2-115 TaxID=3384827 RepID=UPI0039A1F82B
MSDSKRIDVEFSFAADDAWIGRDLSALLDEVGLETYFSSDNPDFAAGYLRKELMGVYRSSVINVMLWSFTYRDKPKGSIVKMENDLIWQRHVGKSEHKTLFILNVGGSSIFVSLYNP